MTLHLAIVFIIGIIDSQVAPSGGPKVQNPLILEFVHFVNMICVLSFIETTCIANYVTNGMYHLLIQSTVSFQPHLMISQAWLSIFHVLLIG